VGHQALIVEQYAKGVKYNVYLAVSVRGVVAYWVTTRGCDTEVLFVGFAAVPFLAVFLGLLSALFSCASNA
jgi:hypothetical protein